jgi:hypothetical protein
MASRLATEESSLDVGLILEIHVQGSAWDPIQYADSTSDLGLEDRLHCAVSISFEPRASQSC